MLHKVGYNKSDEEINRMIAEVDIDGNGTINFFEFKMLMGLNMQTTDTEEDLCIAFSKFDPEKSGFITEKLLRHVMTNIVESLDKEELDALIETA